MRIALTYQDNTFSASYLMDFRNSTNCVHLNLTSLKCSTACFPHLKFFTCNAGAFMTDTMVSDLRMHLNVISCVVVSKFDFWLNITLTLAQEKGRQLEVEMMIANQ